MKKSNFENNDTHFLENLENQTIVEVDIEKRMKEAFIDYAMSVIISRALPDVRDGLKPVHRRILYAMYEEHLTADKPFFKSATTVGNVIGRYHPHGDASVYDALVRMAQDFSLRYPLIDGHGNFGSIDGDPPAAYRYTEARMSKIANELLADINKDTVDFAPNFDEKRVEPTVLPTRIPVLLVNGSSGIAVGMATNIPSHNLREVINGAIAQMENPEITVDELMEYVKGPDFPTKATIMGRNGIRSAYETGRGRIIVRAKTEVIENKDGRYSIVITEIPYQLKKVDLVKSIADLVKDKRVDGIADIRDLSSKRVGLKIMIDLKRDGNPQIVLNQLYKFTRLQDSFSINMLAIEDGKPKVLSLKQILHNYINFQKEIVTRRTKFDLKKAKERMHILEGLRIALANIDEVIEIIRNSYDDAKERLMERFGFSDVQAQSVLDMRLAQLQRLNGEKIEEEYNGLVALTKEYQEILDNEEKLKEVIKEELTAIADKYGDDRLTGIEAAIDDVDYEDLIEEKENVFTITHYGYVKRLPVETYRSQKRGGKGIMGLSTREEDFIENMFVASTHDYILFFTNRGRMYHLKGYQIPEAGRHAKGTPIVNLLPIESDEKITATIHVSKFEEGKFLLMATKYGVVKKTPLIQYGSLRKGALNAISLDEGDDLIKVKLTDGNDTMLLGTHHGMAIKFDEKDVRPMGRTARGVRGIRLKGDDYLIGMTNVSEDGTLLAVTENGYGKKTSFEEYRDQSRGGMGISTYKITEKTGNLIGIANVTEQEDVMLINTEGVIIRMAVADISEYKRATQGVRLIKMADGVKVVSLAITDHEEEEEEVVTEETTEIQENSQPPEIEE
ncbi:MAG: DNA gyrase subunit A [Ruminococcaceae bacterium]|nr:DNA gyrase subunit A [Oscillospiraceae bacterium]